MFFHQSHQASRTRPSVGCNGFLAVDVLGAWRHVQLYIGNTCAILSTIPLFLHEQVHSIQTEEVGAIPERTREIMGKGWEKSRAMAGYL